MLCGGTYLPGNGIRGCGISVFFSFQEGIELGVFLPENGIFAEHKVKSVQQVEFL